MATTSNGSQGCSRSAPRTVPVEDFPIGPGDVLEFATMVNVSAGIPIF